MDPGKPRNLESTSITYLVFIGAVCEHAVSEIAVNTFVLYHKAEVCLDSNKCTRNRGINDNILSDILAFLDNPGYVNSFFYSNLIYLP